MKQSRHPAQTPRFYSTSEVALILETDEWRVRNFGAPAYGLESQIKAPGSGHRKRYFFEVVLKLAVADTLYSARISPAGIAEVLSLIEKQKLIRKWIGSAESAPEMVLSLDSKQVTIEHNGKKVERTERIWKVLNAADADAVSSGELDSVSVAVSLDLAGLWRWVVDRITGLEGKDEI